jgi:hypothetical protein
MSIRLTESRLRQIIREEVSSLTHRPRRMTEGLTVKRTMLYAPSDRTFMGNRAVVTGAATPVEEIAVECQGWFDASSFRRTKSLGLEAVTEKILNLSEFKYQAKKRGMEATPELAMQVAQIFIDLDLT